MTLPLLVLGLVAGVASGMFGIGGGVVIVPVLVTLLGFDLHQANGTSLAALLMPVSIFAVLEYRRAGKLHIPTAAWVAVGLVVGGILGAQLALGLPVDDLKRAYGVFLLYAAWRFAEPRKWLAEARHRQIPAQPANAAAMTAPWYWLLLLGLGAGIAAGMFGIGGGLIIVPALVGLLHFDQKAAVGTSLAALLLPVNLGGVLLYYNAGKLDIGVAALVALGLVGGALAGARIALGLPTVTVKRLYGIFLLIIGLRFIFG
jgi:hypothetical protein